MPLLRRALAAACLAAVGLMPLAPLTPSTASAAVTTGVDYSWPQCAKGIGNGQGKPLPAATLTFAVVGLTNGVGLHENPCLATEWAYARTHASLVTGYTMVTYPTASQRASARVGHYGHCTSLACELRNSGWAQAEYAVASLAKVGAHPPLVWIDVEPRTQQPWSRNRADNSLVVKAVVAGLRARGFAVGIYSNRYLWSSIAGYRTSLPEWVPAESLTKGCSLSFAGGRVLMSQWSRTYPSGNTYDVNGRCAGAPTMSTWWQSSHPVVTSLRSSATGGLYARFGTRPSFSLAAKDPHAAAVVAAPSVAGTVPLFVSMTPTRTVHARTLLSGWRNLGATRCGSLPAAAVTAGVVTVHCNDLQGVPQVMTLTLDANGAPVAVTTAPSATAAPARTTTATLH